MVLSPPPLLSQLEWALKFGAECRNYIAISPWNLNLNSKSIKVWKTAKEMTFLRHLLFGLSDVSLQRYDFANFGLILKKRRICPVLRLFIYSYSQLDLWEFDLLLFFFWLSLRKIWELAGFYQRNENWVTEFGIFKFFTRWIL